MYLYPSWLQRNQIKNKHYVQGNNDMNSCWLHTRNNGDQNAKHWNKRKKKPQLWLLSSVKVSLKKWRQAALYNHWDVYNQKNRNNKCWRGCEKFRSLIHCWWECKMGQPVWQFLWKLKYRIATRLSPFIFSYDQPKIRSMCSERPKWHYNFCWLSKINGVNFLSLLKKNKHICF